MLQRYNFLPGQVWVMDRLGWLLAFDLFDFSMWDDLLLALMGVIAGNVVNQLGLQRSLS